MANIGCFCKMARRYDFKFKPQSLCEGFPMGIKWRVHCMGGRVCNQKSIKYTPKNPKNAISATKIHGFQGSFSSS